jgi:hypothetical protein
LRRRKLGVGYSAQVARAAQALRSALEAFWAGEARAMLEAVRGEHGGEPESRRHGRFLASESAREAFEEAQTSGELSAHEAALLRCHLDRAQHALLALAADERTSHALARVVLSPDEAHPLPEELARMARADDGKRRAELASKLERAVLPIAHEAVAAHARAEAPLLVRVEQPTRQALSTSEPGRSGLILSPFSPDALREPKRDLPELSFAADAAEFLRATKDAAEDAARYSVRALKPARELDWHLLLRGLRAPELDSPRGARERWRRGAAWLLGLSLQRELSARVRAEVDRAAPLPWPQVVCLALPRDVRVAQSAIDYGVASDTLAAGGVGEGLGFALTLPGLPPELRWPVGACLAGALGALARQLWGDLGHLTRVQGLSRPEAERVGRVAGTVTLLHARALVALSLIAFDEGDSGATRCEKLAQALSDALCCELTPAVAGLLGKDRVLARARAHEALAGLSLHLALRERCDEDWFRNPRTEELLRELCGRGNFQSPVEACRELGTGFGAAAKRAIELVT